jgi:hypothetical protein
VTQDSVVDSFSSAYSPLGLIGNPFRSEGEWAERAVEVATEAEANRLLVALDSAARQDKPKPITVIKHAIPSQYPLGAVGRAEYVLVNDEELNILHGYIPFFMMRNGRVRSTLRVLGERLAFRSFHRTLACYLGQVLRQPDEELVSFQVLGQERLDAFAEAFAADADSAIGSVFGESEVERRPELAESADLRPVTLETDTTEDEASPELDATVGDAPGAETVLEEAADTLASDDDSGAVLDYIVEHTRAHLSPVIARALRVYHERGLSAMATEFRVTKAPRKTLSALVKFARTRFRKLVLMYDGFGTWGGVPADLRTQVVASLSEIRWLLDGDAVVVLFLEEGGVPELEEQFSGGTRLDWEFSGVRKVFESPDTIDVPMINDWLAGATLPGSVPFDADDPVVAALLNASNGSLSRFVDEMEAAIDDAANRQVSSLDDIAKDAGLRAPSARA